MNWVNIVPTTYLGYTDDCYSKENESYPGRCTLMRFVQGGLLTEGLPQGTKCFWEEIWWSKSKM